jgi:thiol-disulfide isomerase/thioredoxin
MLGAACWWLAGVAAWVLVGGCGASRPVPVENVQLTPVKAADVVRLVHEPGAKVVLVNLWATWCGPCMEEFPDLVKLARQYQARGVRVLLVSADVETELANVKKFLAKQGVDFPTYMKAEKDMEFINGIEPRWTGALPATVIYDGSGKVRQFWEGKASYREFEQKVLEILNG